MAGNAMVSGRDCDNCLHKRARWFCAADDAFLCQACDASVHSANQLARRHERVRLQLQAVPASWHHGFTRKARSPRNVKRSHASLLHHPQPKHHDQDHKFPTSPPLVPEMGSDEADENDEHFLCRVPTFHQFGAELGMEEYYVTAKPQLHEDPNQIVGDLDSLTGFLTSDVDLAEFAADVESYLGDIDYHDSCGINGLIGALDFEVEDDMMIDGCCFGEEIQKMKVVKQEQMDPEMMTTNDEEEKKMMTRRSKIYLSLNYEDVITAWASKGSPWTTRNRAELGPNDYMGGSTALTGWTNYHWASGGGEVGTSFGDGDGDDGKGGREARVLRYREKRRTRLFSKKIRYEVRKLNAEKRPRMKGRFVKRASINIAASAPRFSLL